HTRTYPPNSARSPGVIICSYHDAAVPLPSDVPSRDQNLTSRFSSLDSKPFKFFPVS
ncbi:hypothetical protein AMECASPLE_034003, partial [Ameca splendens]